MIQQVSGAIGIVVSGDDRARIFLAESCQPDVGGDVLNPSRPKIAEKPDFALAIFCFADGDEVNPAVIVVVEGGNAPGASPIGLGKFDLLEALLVVVPPEADPGGPS